MMPAEVNQSTSALSAIRKLALVKAMAASASTASLHSKGRAQNTSQFSVTKDWSGGWIDAPHRGQWRNRRPRAPPSLGGLFQISECWCSLTTKLRYFTLVSLLPWGQIPTMRQNQRSHLWFSTPSSIRLAGSCAVPAQPGTMQLEILPALGSSSCTVPGNRLHDLWRCIFQGILQVILQVAEESPCSPFDHI